MVSETERPDADRPYDADPPELGGEAACWLSRVCPECGRLAEGEPPPSRCPACGAELLT
jgi:rubrerythrin